MPAEPLLVVRDRLLGQGAAVAVDVEARVGRTVEQVLDDAYVGLVVGAAGADGCVDACVGHDRSLGGGPARRNESTAPVPRRTTAPSATSAARTRSAVSLGTWADRASTDAVAPRRPRRSSWVRMAATARSSGRSGA